MALDQIEAFMNAISALESGGNPNATNGRTGAHGTFQIMPSNWSAWAAEAGLGRNAPKTAENQYRVARHKFTEYYNRFGSWDAVAVAWFAGPGRAARYLRGDQSVLDLSDGNITVAEYISRYQRNMTGGGGALERMANNQSAATRRSTEQFLGYGPGTLANTDPFTSRQRPDTESLLRNMLQDVSNRIAGRTGGNPAVGLEATPGDVDSGEGWTGLPGATGQQATAMVNRVLSQIRDSAPPLAADPATVGDLTGDDLDAATRTDRQARFIEAAKKFLGVDYVWGGTSRTGVDCSGLILLAARELGIELPRVSRDQAKAGSAVASFAEAQAGDLIAFDAGKERGVVNHIGIYLGDGLMLHAPRTGEKVQIVRLSDSRIADILAIRRIL